MSEGLHVVPVGKVTCCLDRVWFLVDAEMMSSWSTACLVSMDTQATHSCPATKLRMRRVVPALPSTPSGMFLRKTQAVLE